jgi:hypothetical protein
MIHHYINCHLYLQAFVKFAGVVMNPEAILSAAQQWAATVAEWKNFSASTGVSLLLQQQCHIRELANFVENVCDCVLQKVIY